MAKIFVVGHNGMVESAIFRSLVSIVEEVFITDRKELDLTSHPGS